MNDIDPVAHRARLLAALRVQHPDVLAEKGFRLLHPGTGDHYTGGHRHLVATCRAIANFAVGILVDGPAWCREAVEHGIEFLREGHRGDDGGYRLVVDEDGDPIDRTRSAYGHAFVLLAYARASAADVADAETDLERTADLLAERFHDEAGCLRSDLDADWNELEPYRGQNANMHACEAYLAAYEASDDDTYLDRAAAVASRITVDLASETDGLLWEHYTADWEHDFAYNEDEPHHQFRPPGYQPGHHVEWAKLLALLDRYDADHAPEGGWYERALEPFDAAVDLGWTDGGFAYTVEADGDVIIPDRYGWALAEGIGAAAALAERARAHDDETAARRFVSCHRRFLDCVDDYRGPAGVWYEKRLAPADGGDPIAPEPPGVEPDYHPVSTFYEGWRSGRR